MMVLRETKGSITLLHAMSTQTALPLVELRCAGCARTDRWVRLGEICGCGWLSVRARKNGHIRGWYANKRHAS